MRRAALAASLVLASSAVGRSTELRLFPASTPGPVYGRGPTAGEGSPGGLVDLEHSYPWSETPKRSFGLSDGMPSGSGGPQETQPPPSAEVTAAPPPPKLFENGTTIITAAALTGAVVNGLIGPSKYGFDGFHVENEGWFGFDTYAGGVDKASHFVFSSGLSRLLFEVYTMDGHSPDRSFAMALGVSFFSGFLVELGDGFTKGGGFSLSDLTADLLGTTAGLVINRYGMKDLLGLRMGVVPTSIPEKYQRDSEESFGSGYSNEIYTGDVKLGGVATRLHVEPGIARYFLVSVAYFTKGYGFEPPIPERYQQVGVELGLNIPEILVAAGVKNTTWWGKALLGAFTFFRVPFTQVGAYYNLRNHKWYGPAAPYTFY